MAESCDPGGGSWESIYRRYLPDACGFLVSRGMSSEAAEEAAHEFFSTVVIHRGLGERLLAAGDGREALLLKALRDFHVERMRRAFAERRRLRAVADDRAAADGPPYDGADRSVAVEMVQEAMRRTEQHYRETGRQSHWAAFETRVLLPVLRGTEPPPVKELARRMGLKRGDDASAMLQLVRQRFMANLLALMGVGECSREEAKRHLESLLLMLSNHHSQEV